MALALMELATHVTGNRMYFRKVNKIPVMNGDAESSVSQ